MASTTIATFLQLIASLLISVQHNPALPPSTVEAAIGVGSRGVQLSTQALAKIPFPVPQNDSIWPNAADLAQAPYLDAQGNYAPLGPGLQLLTGDASFGDLNGDGLDDAAALVARTSADGATTISLAMMLDQGGILFNIADVPLGKTVQVYSHHVVSGAAVIDMQIDGEPRTTASYELLGNAIIKAGD
jgi:hypothetical protein